jgi:hypothetical protein
MSGSSAGTTAAVGGSAPRRLVGQRRSSLRQNASWLRRGARLLLAGLCGGAVLTLIASGCGSIGDENYVPPSTTPLNQVDLANKPFCIGTCTPDYGSTRIDCDAEAGLEFFPVDVMNGDTGTVTGFYAYNDGSADFMVAGPTPFDGTAIVSNDPVSMQLSNYEPPTVQVNDRCGPDGKPESNNVHHLRGGMFTEWGGGMGRRLLNFVTQASPACMARGALPGEPDYCPDPDERIEAAADLPRNASNNLRSDFYGMVADLRGWEGISFWARQGPDNTAGIRVYVGDRQLDDDIAFLEAGAGIKPMCLRARECGCRNHRPCTSNAPLMGFSCWDDELDVSPATLREQAMAAGRTFYNPYDVCGNTLCDSINAAWQRPDPLFSTPDNPTTAGRAQCQLYKLTNDLETYYCYDRENPDSYPPDGPQQCGDGWAKGVKLSTDWQFFTIPFTELRQEGYGQEFASLDLSKITLVRFTWMQGWVDVWLDDVRFYRHAPGAQQTP